MFSFADDGYYVDLDDDEEVFEVKQDGVKAVRRCKACNRMVFGHGGPYGLNKCQLEKIVDEEEMKQDDKDKLKAKKRNGKMMMKNPNLKRKRN